jgi:hypothetical protein
VRRQRRLRRNRERRRAQRKRRKERRRRRTRELRERETRRSQDERWRGKRAKEIIAEEKKGSIKTVFPGEYLDSTWEEINRAAKEGDPKAKTARKVLTEGRFDKHQ